MSSCTGHPWIRDHGVAPDRPLDPAVLSRIKQFSAMNKLKKMALRVSTSLFGARSSVNLIHVYTKQYSNRSITSYSFCVPTYGGTLWNQIALFLRLFARAMLHLLTRSLFQQVIAESLSEEEIAGLKEMFQTMDTDNSGAITYDELKEGLRRYGSTLKDTEIRDLMDAVSTTPFGMLVCLFSFKDLESNVSQTSNLSKGNMCSPL